jgi:hypothetical protein
VAVAADGFLVTSWEAYRLALETTTVVDAAAASLWLTPGADDATTLLAHGLERVFKPKQPRVLARALLAGDEYAFAGYARWQINDRWDLFAGHESLKPYQAEARFFARTLAQARREHWPAAITASLAFRHYLAQRDVFVRETARAVFKLRRQTRSQAIMGGTRPSAVAPFDRLSAMADKPDGFSPLVIGKARPEVALHLRQMQATAAEFVPVLKAGRSAARAMWARTRDRLVKGQNETILEADARRLAAWRDWLRKALRSPALVLEATPVCGRWQLQFMVHNFAPAGQKVSVEQLDADGTWRVLASRPTIEFRALAARPASKLKREFTVPVDSASAKLRILVGGVGQVAISHVTLTNGIETQAMRPLGQKHVIGRRAPQRGLSAIVSQGSATALLVSFTSLADR